MSDLAFHAIPLSLNTVYHGPLSFVINRWFTLLTPALSDLIPFGCVHDGGLVGSEAFLQLPQVGHQYPANIEVGKVV